MTAGGQVKVHQHGTGVVGGNQAVGRGQRGLTAKLHPAADAAGCGGRGSE